MRVMVAIALALGLSGCVTSGAPTPSGSPEITIRAKPDRVRSALLNVALNRGLRVKSDSMSTLILERPTTSLVADVLLSTGLSGSPVDRVTFTLADVGEGTRVVAFGAYVSNAGTAFERGATGRSAPVFDAELQGMLNEAADAARAR